MSQRPDPFFADMVRLASELGLPPLISKDIFREKPEKPRPLKKRKAPTTPKKKKAKSKGRNSFSRQDMMDFGKKK